MAVALFSGDETSIYYPKMAFKKTRGFITSADLEFWPNALDMAEDNVDHLLFLNDITNF